jgi:hypothetical protein
VLLVTFHGDASGESNVFAYDTSNGQLLTSTLLSPPDAVQLNELRSLVVANGYLYVANGGTTTSSVLCYELASSGASTTFVSTVVACTLSKGDNFETSIAHPFGLAFAGSDVVYVSNQDTNVVACAALTNGSTTGVLGRGAQSAYLEKLFPSPAVFLDGTYVASQVGSLRHVHVTAPNVPATDGGLGVKLDSNSKVQHSVRDVALAGGLLLVCDEVEARVNLYATADGSFSGSSSTLAGSPTHLAIFNGGVFVSANSQLYWGQLPAAGGAALSLQQIDLTPPTGCTVGGLCFTGTDPLKAYVVFQSGTGAADGGSIYAYTVTQRDVSTLPVFADGTVFVESGPNTFSDTPEFVLCV